MHLCDCMNVSARLCATLVLFRCEWTNASGFSTRPCLCHMTARVLFIPVSEMALCVSLVQQTSDRVSWIKQSRIEGILGVDVDNFLGLVAPTRSGIWARGSKLRFRSRVGARRPCQNLSDAREKLDEPWGPMLHTCFRGGGGQLQWLQLQGYPSCLLHRIFFTANPRLPLVTTSPVSTS